jgi:hypothetical protein
MLQMQIFGALKRGILLHLQFPFVLLIKFIGKVSCGFKFRTSFSRKPLVARHRQQLQ